MCTYTCTATYVYNMDTKSSMLNSLSCRVQEAEPAVKSPKYLKCKHETYGLTDYKTNLVVVLIKVSQNCEEDEPYTFKNLNGSMERQTFQLTVC